MESNGTDIKSIGERIRKLREKNGLTQSDLAKKLNVKRETVAQWETGARDLKTGYIIDLADCLNVSCDEILRGVKSENINIYRVLGLNDEAIEKLRDIRKKNENIKLLLENDGFKDIVKLLNKIKTLTVGKRYYNTRIISNIESNDILDSLFNNDFNAHIKLLNYIRQATTQFIERQTSDNVARSLSIVETPESYNNLYDEKLVLTEYQLTERVFRTMINDIKNDTSTDKELFKEFDSQIGENLNELLINIKSNLADAHNHYEKCKLDEKEKEMKEEIENLRKFICYYNEKYKRRD